MRALRIPVSLVVFLLTSTPASAELGFGYVFPSSASVGGQYGAYFKTKLSLYNPNSVPITIVTQLLTATGGSQVKNITLPARNWVYWNDYLLGMFGYSGGAGFGLIDSTTSHYFYAVAEVYTESDNGRYSTPLMGMFTRDRVPELFLESGTATSIGLRIDGANRANMGCANVDNVEAVVVANVHGWDGSTWTNKTVEIELPPQGWKQVAVPVQGQYVYIDFRAISFDAKFGTYCYAVNVNNASNDGALIQAQRMPPAN